MKKTIGLILVLALLLTTASSLIGTAFAEDKVVIRFMCDIPDRTSSRGLLQEQMLQEYMDAHPNVVIEVEALDSSSFPTKFKAYLMANELPDIFFNYNTPAWMDPLFEAGVLEPFSDEMIESLNFVSGANAPYIKDGVTYSLSTQNTAWVLYYNKDLFAEHNVAVPTTYDELLAAAKVFKDAGIIPVAIAGVDGWPVTKWATAVLGQVAGSNASQLIRSSIDNEDFSDPAWLESFQLGARDAQELFGYGFETCDYATSQNMFMNGKAAMWWMGSWEMGITPDFNVGAFAFPQVSAEGDGALLAYADGGIGVCSYSEHKDVAMDIVSYYVSPENWSKRAWEQGLAISTQDFYNYQTGSETPLQLDIMNVLAEASSQTGYDFSNIRTYAMESYCYDILNGLYLGLITPEDCVQEMYTAVTK